MPDEQFTQTNPVSESTTPPQTVGQGAIYTMPDRFMTGGSPRPAAGTSVSAPSSFSGKKMVLIIAFIALFLGGLTAGAYFYINSGGDIFGLFGGGQQAPATNEQPNQTPPPQQPAANQNEPTQPETNEPVPPAQDEAAQLARDAQRVKDVVLLAQALQAYYTKFNAYPQLIQVIPKDILADEPKDPLTGRLYAYTTRDSRRSYSIIVEAEARMEFNGKTYEKGTWEFYPEDFNGGSATGNENTNQSTGVPELGNLDSDSDGLTAAEETLFGTSPVNPDTDGDGYRDNIEITNFYSPTESGAIKLDQAGTVKLYRNESQKYSFYYPSSWVVSMADEAAGDVLITTTTGENFSISVKDNTDMKTSWEWYTQNVSRDFNPNSVSIITVGGKEGVKTLDGLGAYVAIGNRILIMQYALNTETVVRYPFVFNFILGRLAFL